MTPLLQSVPALAQTWSSLGTIAVSAITGGAVVAFVMLAAFDRLLIRRLTHEDNAGNVDKFVLASIARSKGGIMDRLNEWYAPDRKRNEDTAREVSVNSDRIEWVEEAVTRQGAELSSQSRIQFESTTKAMSAITSTMGEIQKEAREMAVSLSRIEGRLDSGDWDGRDRRSRPRRESDNDRS